MPKLGLTHLAPALAWPKYFYQGFNRQYFRKILAERPIAYWPMWEASGSVAFDLAGGALHGAYTSVTLGNDGVGDGRSCPLFDGSDGVVNVYSAGLNSVFSATLGSLLIWVRVNSASVWADGAERRIFQIRANGNNLLYFAKTATNNTLFASYKAGGTDKNVSTTSYNLTTWLFLALTWDISGDKMRAFVNGVQFGGDKSSLGTWSGALNSQNCCIGAKNTSADLPWHGLAAHGLLLDAALTPAQVLGLYRV